MRVSPNSEKIGLDISQHNESYAFQYKEKRVERKTINYIRQCVCLSIKIYTFDGEAAIYSGFFFYLYFYPLS